MIIDEQQLIFLLKGGCVWEHIVQAQVNYMRVAWDQDRVKVKISVVGRNNPKCMQWKNVVKVIVEKGDCLERCYEQELKLQKKNAWKLTKKKIKSLKGVFVRTK